MFSTNSFIRSSVEWLDAIEPLLFLAGFVICRGLLLLVIYLVSQ